MAWIFPDQAPAQKHQGPPSATPGCFYKRPSPESHVFPIPQALTAVVLVRVVLTVLLSIALRVLFADAASTAALVRVLLTGDCGQACCRQDGATGVSPCSGEVTSPSPLLPTPRAFPPHVNTYRRVPSPKEFSQRLRLMAVTSQPNLTCAAAALIAPIPTVVLAITFLCAGDTRPVVALEAVSCTAWGERAALRAGHGSCSTGYGCISICISCIWLCPVPLPEKVKPLQSLLQTTHHHSVIQPFLFLHLCSSFFPLSSHSLVPGEPSPCRGFFACSFPAQHLLPSIPRASTTRTAPFVPSG